MLCPILIIVGIAQQHTPGFQEILTVNPLYHQTFAPMSHLILLTLRTEVSISGILLQTTQNVKKFMTKVWYSSRS
jgi:hypothetical protein